MLNYFEIFAVLYTTFLVPLSKILYCLVKSGIASHISTAALSERWNLGRGNVLPIPDRKVPAIKHSCTFDW